MKRRHSPARFLAVFLAAGVAAAAGIGPAAPSSRSSARNAEIDRRAEIRRDDFGVPHILAETEEAAAFAHGYVTAEDHGAALARLFLRARGQLASVFGPASVNEDIRTRTLGIYELASTRFQELPPFMQGILNGYAAGYNLYLQQHRADFPDWATEVAGVDILAHARAVLLLDFAIDPTPAARDVRPGSGSNMWAIGPPLSKSGHGMLLANPHLAWEGSTVFHEVHLTVPDVINVSGGAMIGIPTVTIGFNEFLGWSHTVNDIDSDDVYELTLNDTGKDYLYDGRWLPLEERQISLQVKTESGVETRTHAALSSHHGPIVRVNGQKAYALKSANLASVNFLTQWNEMGKATSLQTFKAAVNMQQLPMFNLGYADRDGNTWYVFNGRIPIRPAGYDWAGIVPGNTSKTEWFVVHPVSELPQLLNPRTGYLQNCNDAPWYANLEQRIDKTPFADYIPEDGLQARSQVSLRILSGEREVTLDELKAYKFNTDVLFAERVKGDLIAALRARKDATSEQAATVLEAWDNRVDADSRGAVLFLSWWNQYVRAVPSPFRTPWSAADPIQTPKGLADPAAALPIFDKIVAAMQQAYGGLDTPWGETHRLKRGNLDLPLGGAPGMTLQSVLYRPAPSAKFEAIGGDTYVLAVEFAQEGPRAYSLVAYSQSSNPRSPHFNDQSSLYASKQFKTAWFSERDITAHLARKYRPDR